MYSVFVVLENFQQIFFRHNETLEFLFSRNYLSCNLLEALPIISFDDGASTAVTGTANFVEEAAICHCTEIEKAIELKFRSLSENMRRRFPKCRFP